MNAVDIALFLIDRRANAAPFHDLPEAWKRQPISDRLLELQQENNSTSSGDDQGHDDRHATLNAPSAAAANAAAANDARAAHHISDDSCKLRSAADETPDSHQLMAYCRGDVAPREGSNSSESLAGCLFEECAAESLVGLRVYVSSAVENSAQADAFGTVIGWGTQDSSKRGSSGSNVKRSTSNADGSQEHTLRCNGQRALVHHIQLDRPSGGDNHPNELIDLTYAEVLIAHGRALLAKSPHAFQNAPPLLLPRQFANTMLSTSFGNASSDGHGQEEFYDAEDDTN